LEKEDSGPFETTLDRVGTALFPPEVKAVAVHLACQKPGSAIELQAPPAVPELAKKQLGDFLSVDEQGRWWVTIPVSRLSSATIAFLLVGLTVVAAICRRTVARWLQADQIKPWRFRSWITPKDLSKFLPRARVILELYERTRSLGSAEVTWSFDECTSLQARERDSHSPPKPGGNGTLLEASYRRRGAVQLFAALNVATGYVEAVVKATKTFADFQAFVVQVIEKSVQMGKSVINIVLDNGSTHRPKYLEKWLKDAYPDLNVRVFWLPVRSSWLNQIEIFFSILKAHVLRLNDFSSLVELERMILDFIALRNLRPVPFRWQYSVVDLYRKYNVRLPGDDAIWPAPESSVVW